MMPAVNDGQKCSSFSILISLPARRRTYTAENACCMAIRWERADSAIIFLNDPPDPHIYRCGCRAVVSE